MGSLRFYLALAVVAWHADQSSWLPFIPGPWAVRVFFVISGFYMSLALTSKYSNAKTFWVNRALRLYPTYLLFVLLFWGWYFFTWAWLHKPPYGDWQVKYAAMQWWQSGALVLSNWTMLGQDIPCLFDFALGSGFTFPGSTADGSDWAGSLRTIRPAWSLGTEAWFYLLVPLLVRLRSSSLCVIGALSFGAAFIASADVARFSFPTNLQFFVLGILAHRHSNAAMAFFKSTADNRWDRLLGDLCYPIYVSHSLIVMMMMNVFHAAPFALVAAVTVATSAAVYQLLERPIDQWRNARPFSAPRGHSGVAVFLTTTRRYEPPLL